MYPAKLHEEEFLAHGQSISKKKSQHHSLAESSKLTIMKHKFTR
jgi:hypothetical protein